VSASALRSLAAIAILSLVALSATAEDEERPASPRAPEHAGERVARGRGDVTPELIRAVRKGLDWLARNQKADGSWKDGEAKLAVTALSVLALMGNGHTEKRGKYAEQVREGVKFLLRHVTMPDDDTDETPAGYIYVKNDGQSKMHAHGYAMLTLALAYGMSDKRRRAEMKAKLELAIRCTERGQDPSGGWGYHPNQKRHEGSITVCQIQALRMARDAGLKVKPASIANAVLYLKNSQDTKTGGFCYSLSERARQTYPLTAAALSTLFSLGKYDERRMIEAGLDFMRRRTNDYRDLSRESWFFYGNFYAAQAMYQAGATSWGEKHWREYWPLIRETLIDGQDREFGNWVHPQHGGEDYGLAYATAFACLILEVPLEVLPLFQR